MPWYRTPVKALARWQCGPAQTLRSDRAQAGCGMQLRPFTMRGQPSDHDSPLRT